MDVMLSYYTNGHLRESHKVTTPCNIGRSYDAGLVVVHPALSRDHCTIYEHNGEIFLKDNGSLNGTVYLGAEISEPVRLHFGDMFTIGSSLTFLISETDSNVSVPGELADHPTTVFTEEEVKGEIGLATIASPPRFPVPYELE
jgi:pSer/pThr/pTyr-binding forkhead associated (FHA) protein